MSQHHASIAVWLYSACSFPASKPHSSSLCRREADNRNPGDTGRISLFQPRALLAQAAPRITERVDTAQFRVLPDHLPAWANASNHVGVVPAAEMLEHLTIVLQRSPEQEAAFQKLLADQQDPASPDFHHWLTPAEVGARFGLADQDIETLSNWLQSQGLHINWVSPSRIFVEFGGAAADVGRAFHAELHSYRVDGEERMSVSSAPTVPQALLPVIKAVHGLYTIENRPAVHMQAAESTSPDFNSNSGAHYITPADFAVLYDLPSESGLAPAKPSASSTVREPTLRISTISEQLPDPPLPIRRRLFRQHLEALIRGPRRPVVDPPARFPAARASRPWMFFEPPASLPAPKFCW